MWEFFDYDFSDKNLALFVLCPFVLASGRFFFCDLAVVYHETAHPGFLLQHAVAEEAFEDLQALAKGIDPIDGEGGVFGKDKGKGHGDRPHIDAVKHEGNEHPSSGAQGEVSRASIGTEGHQNGGDDEHKGRQRPYLVGGVVDLREERCQGGEERTCTKGAKDSKGDHLAVGVNGFLEMSCAK